MTKVEIKIINDEYYLIVNITDDIKNYVKLSTADIKSLNVDIKNIIKTME